MSDLNRVSWFVIKYRFQRVKRVQKRLQKPDIEIYLPMEMRSVPVKGGKECARMMPIFSNMVLVKTTFQRLSEICGAYKDMFYMPEVIDGFRRAIRIPEDQMTLFREFIDGNYESLDCKVTKLKSGEKIVVKSGVFKGSSITFKEERGQLKKEYIVEVNGRNIFFSESSLTQNILSRI